MLCAIYPQSILSPSAWSKSLSCHTGLVSSFTGFWQERSVEKRPGPKQKRMYNQYNPLTLSQQFWYIFVLPFRAYLLLILNTFRKLPFFRVLWKHLHLHPKQRPPSPWPTRRHARMGIEHQGTPQKREAPRKHPSDLRPSHLDWFAVWIWWFMPKD